MSYRRTFLITDIHFSHPNIKIYCNRPDNYEQKLIANWNHLVKPEDEVINLGDVIFHNPSELTNILKQLNGTHILVRGNHDKNPNNWYTNHGFSFICDKIQKCGVLLSHRPVFPIPEDINFNIFGHFHNGEPDRWDRADQLTEKHKLLSIEHVDYKPVLLEECLKGKHVVNCFEKYTEFKKKIVASE
jgi:calcineurin-like phosphoesterase family protein